MIRPSGAKIDKLSDGTYELTYFGTFSPPKGSQTLFLRNKKDLEYLVGIFEDTIRGENDTKKERSIDISNRGGKK